MNMFIYDLQGLKNNNISKKAGKGVSGIYLWGVKYENCYIPLYVGQGANIYERIFQHLSSWRGGEYRIPKWQIITRQIPLVGSIRDKKNLDYFPEGANLYLDFLQDPVIQNVVGNVLNDFFCILYPLNLNERNRSIEENCLAELIGKDKLISSQKTKGNCTSSAPQDIYDKLSELNAHCVKKIF